MNFKEAIQLLEAFTDFPSKSGEKRPNFSIYDNQNQGYSLSVKAQLIGAEYLNYVKKIVESRKLGVRESKGYLIIYGPEVGIFPKKL